MRKFQVRKISLTISILLFLFLIPFTVGGDSICNIDYVSRSTMNLGEDQGILLFQLFDERWIDQEPLNDSILHATCRLNVYEYGTNISYFAGLNGSIIYTEPYDNIEHGDRYTTTLGTVSFMYDLDLLFWQPNTTYAYQLHCYCLNDSTSDQSIHQCRYESDGQITGYLSCTQSGNFTTGKDLRSAQKSDTYFPFVFGIIFIMSLLTYLGFKLDEKHFLFKFLSLCFVFILFPVLGNTVYQMTVGLGLEAMGMSFFKIAVFFNRAFIIYVCLYVAFAIFDYYGKLPRWIKKNWNKNNG